MTDADMLHVLVRDGFRAAEIMHARLEKFSEALKQVSVIDSDRGQYCHWCTGESWPGDTYGKHAFYKHKVDCLLFTPEGELK